MSVLLNPLALPVLTCVILLVVLGSLTRHALPGLRSWLGGGALLLLGLVLLGAQAHVTPLLSVVVANGSFLAGTLLLLAGCRQFFGMRVPWALFGGTLATAVLYTVVARYVYDDLRERLVVYSLLLAVLCGAFTMTVWRHRPRERHGYAYLLAVGTGAVLLALNLARAVAFAWWVAPRQLWQAPDDTTTLVFLIVGSAGTALLMICLLLMAHDRLLAELERIAFHDALTGADSRAAFLGKLGRWLREAPAASLQVLLLDLDHFKAINDTCGHAVGDQVLTHFARLAQGLLGEHETLGRMGGEEFALCFPHGAPQRAAQFDAQLRERLRATPLLLAGQPVRYDYSAGSAIAMAGDTPEQLLARADRGLYAAKRAGRGRLLTHAAGHGA